MQNVLTFWSTFLTIVADFLMEEPIVYFVSVFILLLVVSLLQRILFTYKAR